MKIKNKRSKKSVLLKPDCHRTDSEETREWHYTFDEKYRAAFNKGYKIKGKY